MENHSKLKLLREQSRHKSDFVEARYHHCAQRAEERYGFKLSYDDWERVNYIAFRESEDCRYVGIGITGETGLYIIKFAGQQWFVAFSESAYLCMTIFPRHDSRFTTALHGAAPLATCQADAAFRDAKQSMAEAFDDMVVEGDGRVRLPYVPAPITVQETMPNNVFAKALAGFKPKPVEPTPVASNDPVPAIGAAAMFARLELRLAEQERNLNEAETAAQSEIAELEKRIAQLRASDQRRAMERQYIGMNRQFAKQAFEQMRDGVLDETAAAELAAMIGAQPLKAAA